MTGHGEQGSVIQNNAGTAVCLLTDWSVYILSYISENTYLYNACYIVTRISYGSKGSNQNQALQPQCFLWERVTLPLVFSPCRPFTCTTMQHSTA